MYKKKKADLIYFVFNFMIKMLTNALFLNENWSARETSCGKTETISDFCSLTGSRMTRLIFYLHSVPHEEKNLNQNLQFVDIIWTLKCSPVTKVQKVRFLCPTWVSISHLVTIWTQLVFTFSVLSSRKKPPASCWQVVITSIRPLSCCHSGVSSWDRISAIQFLLMCFCSNVWIEGYSFRLT